MSVKRHGCVSCSCSGKLAIILDHFRTLAYVTSGRYPVPCPSTSNLTFKMTLKIKIKAISMFSILSWTLERGLEETWVHRWIRCWMCRLLRVAVAASRAVFQNTRPGRSWKLGKSLEKNCHEREISPDQGSSVCSSPLSSLFYSLHNL